MTAPTHKPDPLALSIAQAADSTDVSRSQLYEEMRAGRLKYVKVGARRLILVEDLRDWLIRLRDVG
jgi:excisionase family DNA binding protein